MTETTYNELKERVDAYEKLDKEIHILEHTKELLFNSMGGGNIVGIYSSTSKYNGCIEIPKCMQEDLGDVINNYLYKEINTRIEARRALE